MIEDLKQDFFNVRCQKELVSMKFGFLTSKLENAKILKSRMKELALKKDYMSDEQVKEEEIITEEKLKEPFNIISKIEELQNDSEYLNSNKILRGKIESVKLSLRKSDESESHLECVICMSIPKCQTGSVFIYSCNQDHLLCRDCIQRVNSCPSIYLIHKTYIFIYY